MDDNRKDSINCMVKKLIKTIQTIGEDINTDDKLSIKVKSSQMDVLIQTLHFLTNYEENVKVLHDYWLGRNKDNSNEER